MFGLGDDVLDTVTVTAVVVVAGDNRIRPNRPNKRPSLGHKHSTSRIQPSVSGPDLPIRQV